jgi:hypothetical protein
MRMNPNAARCRSSLRVNILVAKGGIGPRPAGTYHHCLKVVFAGEAGRDWTVILLVVVHLVTRYWTPGNEGDESLGRQLTGIPVAVVARLTFLGSVDAEQADTLTTELHGVAIRDSEAMQASRAAGI